MSIRHAIALVGLVGSLSAASAEEFHIEDVPAQNWNLAELKPGTIVFSDVGSGGNGDTANLIPFGDWGQARPAQKKFLSLFPGYTEPTVTKAPSADAATRPGAREAHHVCGAGALCA